MTILLAVRDGDSTWIGSDTAIYDGDMRVPGEHPKWFSKTVNNRRIWLAASGHMILAQLLRDATVPSGDAIVGAVEQAWVGAQLEAKRRGADSLSGSLLLVDHFDQVRSRIYSFDFHGRYDEHEWIAIGSGRPYAVGALWALGDRPGNVRVEYALRAACDHDAWCRGMWIHRVRE